MIATLALTICAFQSGQAVPRIVYQLPIVGGQREIVLGPKPTEFMLYNGYVEMDVAPRHIATPDNTGEQYFDSWSPGGTYEDSLGYFDCVTRPDTLFEKPCLVITTTAKWNQKTGRKPNEIKWQNWAKQQWWIAPDGTIMRHFSALQTPDGMQSGDCTYGKDSIQRRYTDAKGSTTFGEMFPSCGMDGLNAQFKPMVDGTTLLMRDKDFYIANPLTGGLDKYSVHASGSFRGDIMGATFKGRLFDMQGPNNLKETIYMDDSGDLVKVGLTPEKFFVVSNVPSSHLDKDGHPIHKSGGG